MKIRHFLIFAFILLGCGVFLSLEGCKPKEPVTEELTVGAIYPLTGPAASLGQEFTRGATLAVESARNDGFRVKLAVEDSKTDPKSALAAYQKLRLANVRFMLTTVSGVGLALEARAREDGILLFADVAHPSITGRSPLIFRHSSTASKEAAVIAEALKDKASEKIAVLWLNDEYGAAFRQAFLAALGSHRLPSPAHDSAYTREDVELRSTTVAALESKPSQVVIVGSGKQLGLLIARLREQGYQGTIIATMGFTVTPDAAVAAGDAAGGIFHTYMKIDETDTEYQRFADSYTKKYNSKPPTFAVLAYNSTRLILDTVKNKATDPKAAAASILARSHYKAAGEEMTIQANGDILPPVALKQYSGPKK